MDMPPPTIHGSQYSTNPTLLLIYNPQQYVHCRLHQYSTYCHHRDDWAEWNTRTPQKVLMSVRQSVMILDRDGKVYLWSLGPPSLL